MAKKEVNTHLMIDDRINQALALGPMAALYFVVAIDMLKARIESLDDKELAIMFAYLRSPSQARGNIKQIHKILNNLPDK